MTNDAAGTTPGTGPAHEGGHAAVRTYVLIGAILTVVTAAEVAIFYIPALAPVLVPVLITLSVGKFALVVLFFMHLKFDSSLFSRVFFAPLALAVVLAISLLLLFKYLPQFDRF